MLANPQKKKKSRVQGSGALSKPSAKPAGAVWSQPASSGLEDGDDTAEQPARLPLDAIQFNVGGTVVQEERPYPPGLFKQLNFLSEEEEDALLGCIDQQKWANDLVRRTQQYGYTFCYATGNLDAAEPIPAYYDTLIDRLCKVLDTNGQPVFPQRPNQLIVNEYTPGQGINPHIDRDLFEDGIVIVSLLSDIQMVFDSDLSHVGRVNVIETDPQQRLQVQPLTDTMVPVWMERRSLVVLKGESRYKWSHEIPARAHDSKNGRMVRRKRRVSVTFRVVRRQFRTIKRDKASGAPKGGGVEQATAGTSKLALK
eukprot:EG_transcript_16573